MIKYNNLLSFNIIVHNTIKYHRGNQGYIGERSLKDLWREKYSGPPPKSKAWRRDGVQWINDLTLK